MIENNSKMLKLLLNETNYLFDIEDLQHMLECVCSLTDEVGPDSPQRKASILETIITSKMMHRLYFKHVHKIGNESYVNSFEWFFETVLSPIWRRGNSLEDISIQKSVETHLKKSPYNAGLGCYLYQVQERAHTHFPHRDQVLKDIVYNTLRDFDVYRLAEGATMQDLEELENLSEKVAASMRDAYHKFIVAFRTAVGHK